MSSTDKAKLDEIDYNANNGVPTSRTIAGKSLSSNISANDLASALKTAMGNLMYPVGSIYMSVNSTNPSSLFGGTWVAWGSGKVPVGVDADDTDFKSVEKIGGEKTHKLTIEEMPKHNHKPKEGNYLINLGNVQIPSGSAYYWSTDTSASETGDTGGDKPHNNLQPYITCYMWKRIA